MSRGNRDEYYIVYSYTVMAELIVRDFYYRKSYAGMRTRDEIDSLKEICKAELLTCHPTHIDVSPIPLTCIKLIPELK